MEYILREGITQKECGAHILDVNVGLPEIDETAMLTKAVYELQAVLSTPLQLDSSDPEALEAALRIYNGKPMINSVNGNFVRRICIKLIRRFFGHSSFAFAFCIASTIYIKRSLKTVFIHNFDKFFIKNYTVVIT
jgi:cobalamin-dependent methionine synthase I